MAEPLVQATCDCRNFTHRFIAAKIKLWILQWHMTRTLCKLSGCCFLSRADLVANEFWDSTTEGKNCVKETALESEKYCKRVHCQPPSSLSLVLDSPSMPTDHFFKTFDVSTRIALVLIFFFFFFFFFALLVHRGGILKQRMNNKTNPPLLSSTTLSQDGLGRGTVVLWLAPWRFRAILAKRWNSLAYPPPAPFLDDIQR